MKIAITGSSGFVGTNFIQSVKDFKITEVDLLKQQVDTLDFSKVDSVLHLAALVHQMKGAPEGDYFKVNCNLAYEVAKKAKGQGVKQFVFMSTAKVFGESSTNLPAFNEYSECNPLDPYGKSKYEAEKLILALQDESFNVAVVRSPLVYGVAVKANMLSLVKLVDFFPILPLGGINNCRSMVYVNNLVALLKHIIDNNSSGIFIAGDREKLSTTDLARLIAKSFNKRVILFKMPYFLVFFAKRINPAIIDRLFGSMELDNSHTNNRLSFIPPYESEYGIREMVNWYKTKKC